MLFGSFVSLTTPPGKVGSRSPHVNTILEERPYDSHGPVAPVPSFATAHLTVTWSRGGSIILSSLTVYGPERDRFSQKHRRIRRRALPPVPPMLGGQTVHRLEHEEAEDEITERTSR